jgi:uncharacterized protein (AIM24 family)
MKSIIKLLEMICNLLKSNFDPGETVVAEAGAMNYMDHGIIFEAKMGDGSSPDDGIFSKLLNVGKRVLTGESLFITHFTNAGHGKKMLPLQPPIPEKSFPLIWLKSEESFFVKKMPFYALPTAKSLK